MTMREEFETFMRSDHSTVRLEREGEAYRFSLAAMYWDIWKQTAQAAYAAGQRAERKACVATAWIHSMYPAVTEREKGYGEGRMAAAEAIRNRKEQG